MIREENLRELILDILLEVTRDEEYSHLAIARTLEKYQYLPRQDRAFITRVCEGTLEYMIQIDYIIAGFSSVRPEKMKPVILNILRSAVYQIRFMDGVPDSAACNEAVKLAQARGFYRLKGFVNGILRNIVRNPDKPEFPDKTNPAAYLSVRYSVPEWLVSLWLNQQGPEVTEKMLQAFLTQRPLTVRCNENRKEKKEIAEGLRRQGIRAEEAPYLPYALSISGFNYLAAVPEFREGLISVQDVSSMLVAEAAGIREGDTVLDLCAAPGGKSLHAAEKLKGTGRVIARDLTEYKVGLIRENVERCGAGNIKTEVRDARSLDETMLEEADVVLADVPCSGLGILGKKADIRYKMTPAKMKELVPLQREILDLAASYVKPGGVLIYSTCTVNRMENQENLFWFLQNYPFETESLDRFLPGELHSSTTAEGYLQLLPGLHKTDGFFLARLRKKRR